MEAIERTINDIEQWLKEYHWREPTLNDNKNLDMYDER